MTAGLMSSGIEALRGQADRCREVVIDIAASPVGCHLGGSLSAIEILLVATELADRESGSVVVLSKGHAAAALYAVQFVRGGLAEHPAATYGRAGSALTGHPGKDVPGVLFPTGSLGHGLAYAVGWAMAQRMRGASGRAFVIVGDGELQEGLVWEALQIAAAKHVDNLTVVVDANGGQNDGPVATISPISDLESRLRSFGAIVDSVDGHDIDALFGTLGARPGLRAVIANTVKGKGVAAAEGKSKSHYARISPSRASAWKAALAGERA